MNKLPSAQLSPRIDNGILYWYHLDTFTLTLTLNLTDSITGEKVQINPSDEILISFFKKDGCKGRCGESEVKLVWAQKFTNIQDAVELEFDAATTAKFAPGHYTYNIKYNAVDVRTIAALNEIVVEESR